MDRNILVFLLSAIVAACAVAGCIGSPTPSPSPTAAPSPSATAVPGPTLIGGSDEAHVQFTYALDSQSEMYGLQKASPGKLFYRLTVKVTSDKPIDTSADWFRMEYKAKESDSVHTSTDFFVYKAYSARVLQNESDSAGGILVFELPESMAAGYPKPYYYKPLDQQQGTYKVYDKVYGKVGDVQGIPLTGPT